MGLEMPAILQQFTYKTGMGLITRFHEFSIRPQLNSTPYMKPITMGVPDPNPKNWYNRPVSWIFSADQSGKRVCMLSNHYNLNDRYYRCFHLEQSTRICWHNSQSFRAFPMSDQFDILCSRPNL